MNQPSVQIPTDLKQLKKQISALEYQIPLDTYDKDREIHKHVLKELRKAEKGIIDGKEG